MIRRLAKYALTLRRAPGVVAFCRTRRSRRSKRDDPDFVDTQAVCVVGTSAFITGVPTRCHAEMPPVHCSHRCSNLTNGEPVRSVTRHVYLRCTYILRCASVCPVCESHHVLTRVNTCPQPVCQSGHLQKVDETLSWIIGEAVKCGKLLYISVRCSGRYWILI